MENNKVVVLFSGGIDSTVLIYYLLQKGYDIFPLYINYGQVTYKGEIMAVNDIIETLHINRLMELDISDTNKIGCGSLIGNYPENITSGEEWYKNEFFPNRNLLLLSLAATYAYKIECTNLAIGVVGNSYKDTSFEFLSKVTNLLLYSLGEYKIIAPYANKDRRIVIEDAVRLNVPLEKTFSCNANGTKHCRLCISCRDREKAFRLRKKILQ